MKIRLVINILFLFLRANVAADWKVYLGKNRENDSENNDEHVSDVTHIIIHGNYNDETTDNDIAVMVLASQPPEESRFINSVCLDADVSAGFDVTSECFIVGFGAIKGTNLWEFFSTWFHECFFWQITKSTRRKREPNCRSDNKLFTENKNCAKLGYYADCGLLCK